MAIVGAVAFDEWDRLKDMIIALGCIVICESGKNTCFLIFLIVSL